MYYKCTTRYRKSLLAHTNEKFRVIYKFKKWVYPQIEGTKLFVFDNLQSAIDFCGSDYFKRIFECEVKNPTKRYNIFYWQCYINWSVITNMLKLRKLHRKFTHLKSNTLPNNTVVCDAVKLTREITYFTE